MKSTSLYRPGLWGALMLSLLLGLCQPALAQSPVEESTPAPQAAGPLSREDERFISSVVVYSRNNRPQEAAQLILKQPEVAERTFQVLLTALADLPDQQRRLAIAYLNTVARVLESQGRDQFVATLKAYNLLVEAQP